MPKQYLISFITVLVTICGVQKISAQDIDSLLYIQRTADPQEKIYVHFDKNYYNPGETIWFKAYLFTGGEPSLVSKNFYAELLDENGNIIDNKTAPVIGSGANSQFELPATISKSVVYFRAYTTGMLNGDTSFLYTAPVRIIVPAVAAKVRTPKPPVIRFLPEGGDLIAGLKCTVAFKIIGDNGMPVSGSGTIKDNAGQVAEFTSLHDGMGVFSLTPQAGKLYMATWKDASGKIYTAPLPAVKTQGIILHIADEAGSKRFTIQRTAEVPETQKHLHLVGYMNQHMAYAANINFTEKTSSSSLLPTKELPSGILQITVFDNNYKPLAERIVFVNNHDYEFDADAYIPVKNVAKRGLNTLEVMISDTVASNFSLSVTDADLNEPDTYQDNIISHMLLTGDLKGRVNNPYYYFFSTSDSAAFHLDLVMLTNGWRRYNWEQVLAGKTKTPVWTGSNYLSMNGKVASTMPGGFPPGTQLTGILKTIDSVSSFITLPVDKKGAIAADGFVFYDNAKLYFQFSNKKLDFDKSMLTIDNGLRKGYKFAALDSFVKIAPPSIDADIAARNAKNNAAELRLAAQRYAAAHELQNVTVTAKVKSNEDKLEEKYVSGMFTGDGKRFDVMNDPFGISSQSVFQYLQGKVAGLQINTTSNPPSLTWRGGSPSLFLNEMQTDAGQIGNLPMSDIAFIKVFSPGQTGVISSSGSGAIAVYTRKGGDQPAEPSKGLNFLQVPGYSAVKQFYEPDYATNLSANDLDDLRTTLYWNPFIILGKTKKKFKVKFYNNDISKSFRVVLQGINNDGKLFYVEKIVQ